MGNELSTFGGAIATAATSVAAGVTFGQVDALNDAVVDCAKFTGNAASKTVVRHVGETVGTAVATGAVAVASGVTFGQVDALNQSVVKLAKHTAGSAVESGKVVTHTANDLANGIPVVGHIKGGIHYAVGDTKGGDEAMKNASRTTGVFIGGIVGIPGGPAGMIAGGIAGGAAMDGITTGVESAIEGKYTPSGQIKAWTDVANGKDAQTIVGGVVGGIMSPVMDGVGGYTAGTAIGKARAGRSGSGAGRAGSLASSTSWETAESGTSWITALSEGEGSIIHLAEQENVTLYRGINRGKNPFSAGGHGAELGEGVYFTDSLELATQYATSQYEPVYARVPGEVYEFQFRGAEWRDYMKYWSRKHGGDVKHLINVDEFQIIKTGHGRGSQYRFSPHIAEVLQQRNALVKIRDVQ